MTGFAFGIVMGLSVGLAGPPPAVTPVTPAASGDLPRWMAAGAQAMVASDSASASHAGLAILKNGGNAIDAATAVSFALGVTRPYSTGAGGGGFMIARFADGRIVVLDFRETAPARSTPDMYIRAAAETPPRPDASRYGGLAVGVPGVVAGRCQALARYGTMTLAEVLQPAIRIARDGFPADEHYVKSSRDALDAYRKHPRIQPFAQYVYEVHLAGGRLHAIGDAIRQPRLAAFLTRLAQDGPDFFYRGAFAKALEDTVRRSGGILSATDLAGYRVQSRTALIGQYRNYRIIAMPPPSSGGVAILETLNALEPFPLGKLYADNPGETANIVVEAMKHAFADRARWLADADFAAVPVARLTSKSYGAELAARIRAARDHTRPLDEYGTLQLPINRGGGQPPAGGGTRQLPEDHGTSHFCIADRWGNVVVSTETINTSFGSLMAVDDWGVILNNEMDDFQTRPGQANVYGLIQSDRNAVQPGKRPLSSMSPTIVLREDQPYLLLGASGGPRIITSVLDVLIGVVDFDRSLQQAMIAPRMHHQWRPAEVFFDQTPPDDLAAALRQHGHRISPKRRTGIVQAILKTPTGYLGASDPRKGGQPAGD